ncbi:MAG: hypothetical protein AAGA03_08815 [Planctomycetota bacterium]
MNGDQEQTCLLYLSGELPADQRQRFEARLASSDELQTTLTEQAESLCQLAAVQSTYLATLPPPAIEESTQRQPSARLMLMITLAASIALVAVGWSTLDVDDSTSAADWAAVAQAWNVTPDEPSLMQELAGLTQETDWEAETSTAAESTDFDQPLEAPEEAELPSWMVVAFATAPDLFDDTQLEIDSSPESGVSREG